MNANLFISPNARLRLPFRIEQVRIMALAFAMAGTCVAHAADKIPACPKSIAVTETAPSVPPGFHAYQDGNPPREPSAAPATVALDRIMFSDGPPTEMAWLAPESTRKGSVEYDLTPSPGKDIWLSCGYQATSMIMSTRLPNSVKRCQVTIEESTQTPTGMICK